MSGDDPLLLDILRAVLARSGGQRWAVRPTEAWCHVTPPDGTSRLQGWKLHVSATPLSAPQVLARAAEVLVRHGCSFKFATDLSRVADLVGAWCDRGGSGKFITAYPRDDDRLRVLARELDEATDGLPGPRILSDRQVRPSSLVHLRFGVFEGTSVFTDDGVFQRRLAGPNGTVVDERKAWFSPPAWVVDPLSGKSFDGTAAPDSMLLAGRFRVRGAIRHANKGGVYRATDELRAAEVVLKQARAHADSRLDGTDARDRLRDEARMLQTLAPLDIAPAMVALFEEQGDVFLAQEHLSGVPLERWVPGEHDTDIEAMATRLIAMTQQVHDAGLVVRDLKPPNVMVTERGELKLIDTEFVVEHGRTCAPAGTQGFIAPEVRAGGRRITAHPASDLYSLGVTLFCAATGLPSARFLRRVARLSWIAQSHPALSPLIPLIMGLTHPEPDRRWPLERARDFVRAAPRPAGSAPRPRGIRASTLDRILADGLARLRNGMTPSAPTLWPVLPEARDKDVCAAWDGAAGVLATLTRAGLRDCVATAAAWIDERLFAVPKLLPGLCFGRAGTAWALHDAAVLLGDDRLAARALELAVRLPVRGPSPDITHGLSGGGLALLHLWHASGDPAVRQRAMACADSVLAAAVRAGDEWHWPTSTETDSTLAGLNTYGFAHGVAGAGMFLLSAAHAGAHGCMEAALGAGETLATAAVAEGTGARWPAGIGPGYGDVPLRALGHWCNGPAGIGTFLLHLCAATGDRRHADLAERAAEASTSDMWATGISACCGLAGDGHFLLDLAEMTGQRRFHARALEVANVIATQLDGQADRGWHYGYGVAGVLDFLLRLRHGGPRPWIPRIALKEGGTHA